MVEHYRRFLNDFVDQSLMSIYDPIKRRLIGSLVSLVSQGDP